MFGVALLPLTHINSDEKMKRASALANALSKWYKMANFNRETICLKNCSSFNKYNEEIQTLALNFQKSIYR